MLSLYYIDRYIRKKALCLKKKKEQNFVYSCHLLLNLGSSECCSDGVKSRSGQPSLDFWVLKLYLQLSSVVFLWKLDAALGVLQADIQCRRVSSGCFQMLFFFLSRLFLVQEKCVQAYSRKLYLVNGEIKTVLYCKRGLQWGNQSETNSQYRANLLAFRK